MIEFGLESGDLDLTFVLTVALTLCSAALLALVLIASERPNG